MSKPITIIAVLGLSAATICETFAEVPEGYYGPNPSRAVLQEIINDHVALPYSSSKVDASDALAELDADPDNVGNVILVYSRRSEPISNFGIPSGWNREHLWPNSYGIDKVNPAYSDLHNLRAADWGVNSSRSNLFYDVSETNDSSFKDPAHSEAPLATKDSDSWQPPPDVRGDVARAAFYMDVRYAGDRSSENDLWLTDEVQMINSEESFFGKLATLINWHLEDPVDDFERRRNDLIYSTYQGNRNPFIDHPEWVEVIYAEENRTQPPVSKEVAKGIEQVKANPAAYGLYTESDLNASVDSAVATARTSALTEGRTAGIQAVKTKPSDYGLFAAADVNASVIATRNTALAEGRTTGIAAVKAAPSEHGLYAQADLNASVASARTAGIAEGRSAGVEEGKELGRAEGQATGIQAVKADPSAYGLAPIEELTASGATPHTNGWYYQPEWGWIWTNAKTFPYVYRSSTGGKQAGWLYFREGSAPPYFHDYATGSWVTLGSD